MYVFSTQSVQEIKQVLYVSAKTKMTWQKPLLHTQHTAVQDDRVRSGRTSTAAWGANNRPGGSQTGLKRGPPPIGP